MNRRLPLFVQLTTALVFLASLFLPWRETRAPGVIFSAAGPILFQDGGVLGWLAVAGDVAVLLVVATVLATVAALRRPRLAARLPIGGLGVGLGYFAVAVAVEVHLYSQEISGGFTGTPRAPHTSWTYGFYLGLASAGIAAVSALAFRRSEPLRLRGAADRVGVVLAVALLVSFLLPWADFRGFGTFSIHGIEIAAAAIAALVLVLGGGWLHGEAGRRWRLPLAIAIAILTGGAAGALPSSYAHRYGMWIGIGCAVSLVALEAVRARPVRLPVPPHGPAAVRIGAAALLIVSLFLPWREIHGAGASGQLGGWYSVSGAAAGGLCLLLLATPALPALESWILDAAVAVVIFVSVAGTAFREETFVYRIGYGAFVGFAAAGILLVTALMPLRAPHVDRRRALARAVPLAASVLCIAAIIVPLWFVLPENWTFQASALYGSLAVPGVLLSLYLIRLWASWVRGPTWTGRRLTLVPLILLTLASLELIRFRNSNVIWGAVILVGLCLLLALFGWIEETSGLERVRVPEEAWRLDRLPEAES
jgi:hypothetical protein